MCIDIDTLAWHRRYLRTRALGPRVWCVWDAFAGREVVEKSADSELEQLALAREALLLSSDHPGLPRLLDVHGALSAPDALVLEHVAGAALGPSLSPTQLALVLADQLCALERLHELGFVHGDLKPEHLRVDERGRGRLIDLGLAWPIGEVVRGGTPRYMAPELSDGGPCSVASDLFAFGAAVREAVGTPEARLEAILKACSAPRREDRPSSALAMIHALGQQRRRLDVVGHFEWVGDSMALARAVTVGETCGGHSLWVSSALGSGWSRFTRALCASSLSRSFRVVVAGSDGDHGWLSRWAALHRATLSGDRVVDAAHIATRVAREGLLLVFQLRAREELAVAVAMVAATQRARRGGVIVLAPPDTAPALPFDVERVQLPVAGPAELAALFSAAGARLDPRLAPAILDVAQGRMGDVARIARRAGHHPLGTPEELRAWLQAIDPPPSAPPKLASVSIELLRELSGRDPSSVTPCAERLLAAGALPTPDRLEVVRLWAQACARGGDYARARSLLEPLSDELGDEDRAWLLECLERLGDHRVTRDVATTLHASARPAVRALARVLGAHAVLALGHPEQAARWAEEGGREAAELSADVRVGLTGTQAGLLVRAWALQSDAALRLGQVERALDLARRGLELASQGEDPSLLAQALARVAAARALGGDPQQAKLDYAQALAHAERAADVGRLPAFIMNLATTEHALFELGPAIEHYQEAKSLAERLGRRANALAATTNLAGAWIQLGAEREASQLLDAATELAAALGDEVYAAQCTMLRAELMSARDLPLALELARAAERAFGAAGALRQALEAELLVAELGLAAGASERAGSFVAREEAALQRAGLGGRAALLAARAELALGRLGAALTWAELAERHAQEAGDRETRALALFEQAKARERAVPGSGGEVAQAARATLLELGQSLPTNLREPFLRRADRKAVLDGIAPAQARDRTGLSHEVQRVLSLVRRLLLEGEESRVLSATLEEAVAATGAERALLVMAGERKSLDVVVAHNVDSNALRTAPFRFSRSVVERVIEAGQAVVTASAAEDPALDRSRSILDLGLRSILAVPIRGPRGTLGALYLDHRLERGRFGERERELLSALADVAGVALEKTRLLAAAEKRADALELQAERMAVESARRAAEVARLAHLLATTRGDPEEQGGIVGRSHKLRLAIDVARRVAASDLPVLIRGESGTGKELFARFVHGESPRARQPFVAINCGAVPEPLLESELFGHKRGAFTGAISDHPGLFREADGGTLFLDEIGEMPLRMQTRLLRVLQEGEVRPVGGGKNVRVDVRIVAASHRNLEEATANGTFREDLFYRLLGARVVLPALRERREDILEIARVVLSRVGARYQCEPRLSKEAEAALLRHDWPGNVRELEQTLTRGALLSEGGLISAAALDLQRPVSTRRDEIQHFDRALIEQALAACRGNRTRAAKSLGVSRVTLHRWIKRYDVR